MLNCAGLRKVVSSPPRSPFDLACICLNLNLSRSSLMSLRCSTSWRVQRTLSSHRHLEQSRRLVGHANNIPCIAFCNTFEDRRGRYLASTDIAGVTMIWDVDRSIPVRILKAPHPVGIQPIHGDYDRDSMGWGALFLDKRSFTPTKSIVEEMGTCDAVSGTITSW